MGRVLVQQPGTNTTKALSETLPKNVIIVDEDLKELRLHDGVTPGGKIIGQSAGSGVPVGTIIPFAGNSVPQGYLLCDGSAISRTDYASLFAVIGTIYGAGDGNSTFNLPDIQWRSIEGRPLNMYVGEYANGSLPAITGRFRTAGGTNTYRTIFTEISGVFYGDSSQSGRAGTTSEVEAGYRYLNMDAARSSSVYWRTDNEVHTKHVGMYYVIKYI